MAALSGTINPCLIITSVKPIPVSQFISSCPFVLAVTSAKTPKPRHELPLDQKRQPLLKMFISQPVSVCCTHNT